MKITVKQDEITQKISNSFDFEFDGTTHFEPPIISPLDREMYINNGFSIGLIVGPSGSGKSTLLKEFGTEEEPNWDPEKAIVSHFKDHDEAVDKLSAVGFNSIPSWLRPFHVCSNGEQFRASLARKLKDNAVIDEFTSVIDRNVAKSCSLATRKYIDKKDLKGIVFSTCHYDIIEWLQPDWVFDTKTGVVTPRGSLRRPVIDVEVLPCSIEAWSIFREHHYLTGDINKSAKCWLAIWEGQLVGFSSVISFPSGSVKNAFRSHRIVVLPDFQGLGIGVRLSEAMGEIYISEGKRFFGKTSHPRLGAYRENSPKWKPTSHNKKNRKDYEVGRPNLFSDEILSRHSGRVCYAHEYIG